MSNSGTEAPVASIEQLARFIVFSGWIRRSDQTVKQDAFIPPPDLELSVTRHKNLSEQELWRIGQSVADSRPAKLHGRADIRAVNVRQQALDVEPNPVPGNPNHANVIGWPVDKPAQKIIAQELAAKARFLPTPQPK